MKKGLTKRVILSGAKDLQFLLTPVSCLLTSAVVFCLLTPSLASAAYSYSRSITLTSSSAVIPSTQTNFTVKLCFNSSGDCNYGTVSGLNQSGAGAHVQNANGYDIVFTSDSGCTTLLNWEVEHYVASTGELVAHVLFTSLATSTVIYMCYGNAAITTFQGGSTGAAWDTNSKGVWHLPDGTTLTANDSTTNGNNGTVTSVSATAGQIDGAGSFSGSPSHIVVSSSPIVAGDTNWTISAWLNTTFAGAGSNAVYAERAATGNDIAKIDFDNSSPFHPEIVYRDDAGDLTFLKATTGANDGSWHQVVATLCAGTFTIYVDGSSSNSGARTGNDTLTDAIHSWIGGDIADSGAYFNGSLDEVAASNACRSANWITIDYNNVHAPTSFYTLGNECAVGSCVVHTFDPTVFLSSVFDTGGANAFTELLTENLAGSDSASRLAGMHMAPKDTVAVNESVAGKGAHFAMPSDQAQLAESGSERSMHFAVTSENNRAGETPALHAAHFAAPADSTAIAEILIGSTGHKVSFSDHAGVAEAQSFRNGKGVLVRDQLQAADRASGHGAHFAAPSDQSGIRDSESGIAAHFSSASESSVLADAAVRLGAHFAVPSEAEELADSAARRGAHYAAPRDVGQLADLISRSAGLHARASDIGGVFESICSNCTGNHLIVRVFEYTGSSDELGMRQALSRLTVDTAAAADRPGLALIRPSKQGAVPAAAQSGNIPAANAQGAEPAANGNGSVTPALLQGIVPPAAQHGGVAP